MDLNDFHVFKLIIFKKKKKGYTAERLNLYTSLSRKSILYSLFSILSVPAHNNNNNNSKKDVMVKILLCN